MKKMKKMKKMMKNMVCMLLCAVMALSVITIPEKVTAETTTKNTLYRYREVKTGKFGCVNRKGKVIVKPTYDFIDTFDVTIAFFCSLFNESIVITFVSSIF